MKTLFAIAIIALLTAANASHAAFYGDDPNAAASPFPTFTPAPPFTPMPLPSEITPLLSASPTATI